MRAMMSLPVPLSPSMSTGTFALATFSSRFCTASMASDLPKTTAAGGNSPSDCTRELTGPIVVIMSVSFQLDYKGCTRSAKSRELGQEEGLICVLSVTDSETYKTSQVWKGGKESIFVLTPERPLRPWKIFSH